MRFEPSVGIFIRRIAGKEVSLFFASPVAYLFLASFAGVTLFVFFWGEAFFSRNIADVRPLFEWMPLLLIFLSATLTMRLWSEERRTGTLEHVLTQALPLWYFVVGKFASCLVLLAIALAMTLPLPLTVSLMGDLDWGPVWAGYLATFLLGAAYLSIGLFVSARSDNQIVSLIAATAVCGVFYLVGAPIITDFFGNQTGEVLRLLGTGSRFEAITRGVIDMRDLVYYFSVVVVFLTLNTVALEKERWATKVGSLHHQRWRWVSGLLIVNALAGNIFLGQMSFLRVDVTEGKQYSLSEATQGYLDNLREPLLLRGYFSSKTHPLLAPLVPQLRDLMEEYEIAGNGKIRVEFLDPLSEPELEEEANQKFGIEPVPFQVADRYQSSIVSSYFNVLVQYGDEYQVLAIDDFIEVQARTESDIDVQLRNPEHDLTRTIKKVLNNYQAGGKLFDTVQGDLVFEAFVSADHRLPEPLVDYKARIQTVLESFQEEAGSRFQVRFMEPEAGGGALGRQIEAAYGFAPMATSLFDEEQFYFYMVLSKGEQVVQIPLEGMSEGDFERNLKAGIKRFASGFTKTVAFVAPTAAPATYGQFSMNQGAKFSQLTQFLGAELDVQLEDLSDGRVSGEADLLVLAAPKELSNMALFAVDQFLMQGGTVIIASSPYAVNFSNRSLNLEKNHSGIEDWLAHHGLNIDDKLVLDSHNSAFPVPVTRNIGGFELQEMRMLDYPYFIDVRGEGLNQGNTITAHLPQLSIPWASPILVDASKQGQRQLTQLLKSSEQSWLSSSLDIMPRIDSQGLSAFNPEGEQKSYALGVINEGRFDSYFAGKVSPLIDKAQAQEEAADEFEETNDETSQTEDIGVVGSVIARSPESARIILFSSNDFLRDQVTQLASAATGGEYLGAQQLLANTVDWALEETGLLSIRSRSHFNRTLPPLAHSEQLFWEYLNYALAAITLGGISLFQRRRRHRHRKRVLAMMDGQEGTV